MFNFFELNSSRKKQKRNPLPPPAIFVGESISSPSNSLQKLMSNMVMLHYQFPVSLRILRNGKMQWDHIAGPL